MRPKWDIEGVASTGSAEDQAQQQERREESRREAKSRLHHSLSIVVGPVYISLIYSGRLTLLTVPVYGKGPIQVGVGAIPDYEEEISSYNNGYIYAPYTLLFRTLQDSTRI